MTVPLRARVLIADDHTVVWRGLRMVLDAAPDLEVVAEAEDGIQAVELGLREDVDLAVLDVAMPRRTGLEAARELVRRRPELRVLLLSMHEARGVLLRGAEGRGLGLRAQDRGRPRPRGSMPCRDARRVVPVPAHHPVAHAGLSRAIPTARGRGR